MCLVHTLASLYKDSIHFNASHIACSGRHDALQAVDYAAPLTAAGVGQAAVPLGLGARPGYGLGSGVGVRSWGAGGRPAKRSLVRLPCASMGLRGTLGGPLSPALDPDLEMTAEETSCAARDGQ